MCGWRESGTARSISASAILSSTSDAIKGNFRPSPSRTANVCNVASLFRNISIGVLACALTTHGINSVRVL
jgi:hypothetical protein